MAARGARTRHQVEKSIKKEERKQTGKDYISDLSRDITSPSAVWTIPKRSGSSQGNYARPDGHTRTDGYAPSLVSASSGESRSNTVAGSELSGEGKTKKYIAKGKDTSAPRGRGGGVPVKAVDKTDRGRQTPFDDPLRSPISPGSSSGQLSRPERPPMATRDSVWSKHKIWMGQGQTKPYNGLEDDTELWMPSGDCLIYFSEHTNYEDPRPSLRIHTGVLEQANCAFLSHLLKYGELSAEPERDNGLNKRESSVRMSKDPSFLRLDAESIRSSSTHLGRGSLVQYMSGVPASLSSPTFRGRTQEPNPARASGRSDFESGTVLIGLEEPEITHEIWFRAPSHITAPHIQRRYHIATRNFLAMLYGRALVGADLYEMLSDLQNVMQTYYELNDVGDRRDCIQDIIYYLTERKMDDVRNNPRAALQLLAWCELENVRWNEGYTETFVHVVGMMTSNTMQSPEFKALSRVTRHNLECAYNALQLRIIEAEERLGEFNFNDLWIEEVAPNHPAMRSFDAFRTFIQQFYNRQYRGWPPKATHSNRWLNRTIARRLQADFGVMYDYFVDREVAWDVSETRASRKWQILPMRHRPGFSADNADLPLTDMLIAFDYKHSYQHIPHPYPLLPQPMPSQKAAPAAPPKKGLLGGLKKAKAVVQRDPKEHFQTSLAFNGATNINRFGFPTEDNKLVDELREHEKIIPSDVAPPPAARLGRWVMLYGILQVLSNISVDTEGLKYTADVAYFLGAPLDGCPPWGQQTFSAHGDVGSPPPLYSQCSQERSYCWQAPARWIETKTTPPAYEEEQPMAPSPLSMPPGTTPPSAQYEQQLQQHQQLQQRRQFLDDDERADSLGDLHHAADAGATAHHPPIGVALFPDMGELTLADAKGGVRAANLRMPGVLKPELPVRSPRRGMSPMGTPKIMRADADWTANGYFGNVRG